MQIVFMDLFAGAGGFAKGFLEAGFKFSKHYFSEKDKWAIANYKVNFPNAEYIGTVEEVSKTRLKSRPHIIAFGSPCQDLSPAGKGAGIRKGKRSSLFFEAMRIVDEFKPDYFVFENVKGLFSSNGGKDFEIVLQEIANLGVYDIQWQLVDSSWFLPQSRQRVYIVGHHRGSGAPSIFPLQEAY